MLTDLIVKERIGVGLEQKRTDINGDLLTETGRKTAAHGPVPPGLMRTDD